MPESTVPDPRSAAFRRPRAWITAFPAYVPLLIVALTSGIFALDLVTPLGWADGFLYLAPLILLYRSPRRFHLIGFAVLCSLLILLGWVISPPGGALAAVAYNRALSIAAVWMTALFLRYRRDAEEALYRAQVRNEEKSNLLLDHANDAIFYLDLKGVIQWAGHQATVITGRSMGELIGQPFVSVLTPESASLVEERLAAVRRGQSVTPLAEFELSRQEGKTIWVEANSTSVQENGCVVGRLVVARDITERKQAEAELLAMKNDLAAGLQRMELAMHSAELGFWDLHIPTGHVTFNRRWAEMLGFTPEEIQPHYDSWKALIHPDDSARVLDLWNAHLTGRTATYRAEHRLRNKFGNWQWILTHGKVLERDSAGDPVRAFGIHMDITEQKRAEEAIRESDKRVRTIFEQAPLGIAVLNSQTGQFIEINEKYCQIAGYPEQELLQSTFQDITHPDDLQLDLDNMKRLLDGRIGSFEMDKRYIRKDCSIVWVHLTVVPLWWGSELPRHHIAMVEDITQRKEAEVERSQLFTRVRDAHEALRQLSRRLLEVQEDERRRIAQELHDETGQSLTSLLVGLRALETAPTDTVMREQAGHLKTVASNALHEIQRLARGLHPAVLEDMGLDVALRRLAKESAAVYGFSVDLHVNGLRGHRLPPHTEATLYRIAQEALTNVVRHASAKHVGILLHRTPTDIKLIVEDDGCGFDVRQMLGTNGKTKGLGLLGMHERVLQVNGGITIESSRETGTAIYVQVPMEVVSS